MTVFPLFIYILAFFGFLGIVLISYDSYLTLKEIFSRYHIGRWNSFDHWRDSVERCVKEWLVCTPVVPKVKRERLSLIDSIFKRNYSPTIQHWQIAGLILGEGYSIESKKRVDTLIDRETKCWTIPIDSIEIGLLGFAILLFFDSGYCKPAMDQLFQFICSQKDPTRGTIPYRKGWNSVRFVDTLGFVCPFLVLYGNRYHIQEAIDIAENCINEYYVFLSQRGLPPHAYNMELDVPLGIYDWGRGVGWYILALLSMESFSLTERKAVYEERIIRLADNLLVFQNKDGGFSSSLFISSRPSEGSSTVLCALLLEKAYELTSSDCYYSSISRALSALQRITRRSGALDMCQGDTMAIGAYSSHYSVMPFAQGLLLLLIKKYSGKQN